MPLAKKKPEVKRLNLYELSVNWFREQSRKKGALAQEEPKPPPHFRISEYQKLHFFWDELGLNLRDLERIETEYPGWADALLSVGSARISVTNEQMDEAAAQGPSTPQAPIAGRSGGMTGPLTGLGGPGKQVIRRKLL